MNRQEIYLSSSKHKSDSPKEILLEFENGSYIIGIDLANDSKIVRGNRSKIIWIDSKYMQQQNRKWIRGQIKIMKLKWHQKLRIEIEFILEDIKEQLRGFAIKMQIRKGE